MHSASLSPKMSPNSRAPCSCLLEHPFLHLSRCSSGPHFTCPSSSDTLILSPALRTLVTTPVCYNPGCTALISAFLASYADNVSVNLFGEETIKSGSSRRLKPRIFQLASGVGDGAQNGSLLVSKMFLPSEYKFSNVMETQVAKLGGVWLCVH